MIRRNNNNKSRPPCGERHRRRLCLPTALLHICSTRHMSSGSIRIVQRFPSITARVCNKISWLADRHEREYCEREYSVHIIIYIYKHKFEIVWEIPRGRFKIVLDMLKVYTYVYCIGHRFLVCIDEILLGQNARFINRIYLTLTCMVCVNRLDAKTWNRIGNCWFIIFFSVFRSDCLKSDRRLTKTTPYTYVAVHRQNCRRNKTIYSRYIL